MKRGRPLICGQYPTVSDWLRETALAYSQHGDEETATGLFELAGEMAEVDRLADIGVMVEKRVGGSQPRDVSDDYYLLQAANGDEDIAEDALDVYKALLTELDDGESMADADLLADVDLLGIVRRLVMYRDALSVALGFPRGLRGVRALNALPQDALNAAAFHLGQLSEAALLHGLALPERT